VKKSAPYGYVIGLLISGYYTRKNVDYNSMGFQPPHCNRLPERTVRGELAQRRSRTDFVWLNSLSAERHSDLIRAGHCAGFTDFIDVGGLAPASGGVGIQAVVCRRHPHNSIPVDMDLARSCATPG